MDKLFGVIGLVAITIGILLKKRADQNVAYIIGGLFLWVYSYLIGDLIFLVLQSIFTAAAAFDLHRLKKKFL